jgi:hypothetical protein
LDVFHCTNAHFEEMPAAELRLNSPHTLPFISMLALPPSSIMADAFHALVINLIASRPGESITSARQHNTAQ